MVLLETGCVDKCTNSVLSQVHILCTYVDILLSRLKINTDNVCVGTSYLMAVDIPLKYVVKCIYLISTLYKLLKLCIH